MLIEPILLWVAIGLACFAIWFGYNEHSLNEFSFIMLMSAIVFIFLGPITVFFTIFRFFGHMIADM